MLPTRYRPRVGEPDVLGSTWDTALAQNRRTGGCRVMRNAEIPAAMEKAGLRRGPALRLAQGTAAGEIE